MNTGSALMLTFLLLGAVAGSSLADPAKNSPYVRLYEERVKLASAELKKQKAESTFQAARFERARYLLGQHAVSREEYERTEADYRKSLAEEDVLGARIKESEATLDVVKQLVLGGQPVPFCRD